MDFTRTEAQVDLGALTRSVTASICTDDHAAHLDSLPDRIDVDLWKSLAGAGVLSAGLPSSAGGDDLGMLETTTVLTELGRALAAVPYLTSIVLSAGSVSAFGRDEQIERWAAPAGRGDIVVSAALDEELDEDGPLPTTSAHPTGNGWRITGSKTMVPFAPVADVFLLPANTPDGVAMFLVDASTDGVTVERTDPSDHGSVGFLDLSEVMVDDDRRLPGDGSLQLSWLRSRGTLCQSAFQLGVLERALEMTAHYATEREQFGKKIGGFQAVAQRLADAYIDVKALRLTVTQAAWRLSEGLESDSEVATAKFWAADAGHRLAHTAVHVHGGVGLDRDYPLHRYFLAAKAGEFAFGSASIQLRRIGAAMAASPA